MAGLQLIICFSKLALAEAVFFASTVLVMVKKSSLYCKDFSNSFHTSHNFGNFGNTSHFGNFGTKTSRDWRHESRINLKSKKRDIQTLTKLRVYLDWVSKSANDLKIGVDCRQTEPALESANAASTTPSLLCMSLIWVVNLDCSLIIAPRKNNTPAIKGKKFIYTIANTNLVSWIIFIS